MKVIVALAAVALATVAYAEAEPEAQGGYGRTRTRPHTKTKSHTRSRTKGGAVAGPTDTVAPDTVSYTTVTYSDCPSSSMETLVTVTHGVTVTYCPECEAHSSTKPAGPGYTTTYTTTYMSLCPTGVVPQTYTITESCTEPEPTWTPGPSHIPQGFTVTTKECHVCGESTPLVTVTEPCGCEAHEGQPGPPTPKPTAPGSSPAKPTPAPECDGEDCGGSSNTSPPGTVRPPAECDGDDCGGSSTPGGSSPGGSTPGGSSPPPECDGEGCGGSSTPGDSSPPGAPGSGPAPPYPTPSNMGGNCPGPQCKATATGFTPPGRINYGNTTGIVPAGNGASSSFGLVSSSLMAVVIGAFALAL
ncbi:hypothetical protein LTR09_005816 [Extremus antarcticus]|uniref:Uncharacterized protein n=1 Tax=Extremus antarcticus TaxID=702011 RepID=A0AAJ0DG09_9PEZI|nr:hypothetical protein LTR09_005816 [Extremus antarcticus]